LISGASDAPLNKGVNGQSSYDANGCVRIKTFQHAMLSALLSALRQLIMVLPVTPPASPTALTPKLPVDRLQSSLEHGAPEAFAITVASASSQSP
jgi:hypothetical protein